MPDTNEEVIVDTTNNEEGEPNGETISISKAEWEKSQQTIGSMKRELKDLKKPKEGTTETSTTKPDDSGLSQKAFLRAAGISTEEEVELALVTAKKWDMTVDKLVDDEDFKAKLDKLRTQKSNEIATSNVRGSGGTSQAKSTPEYWIAKGVPPTASDVPDRKTRAKIARSMMSSTKNSKKFYSD